MTGQKRPRSFYKVYCALRADLSCSKLYRHRGIDVQLCQAHVILGILFKILSCFSRQQYHKPPPTMLCGGCAHRDTKIVIYLLTLSSTQSEQLSPYSQTGLRPESNGMSLHQHELQMKRKKFLLSTQPGLAASSLNDWFGSATMVEALISSSLTQPFPPCQPGDSVDSTPTTFVPAGSARDRRLQKILHTEPINGYFVKR